MLRRSALLTVLAVLAWGSARAESRDQEELQITLNCKPPSFKVKRPELIMNGGCPLSDGIFLKVNLSRVAESVTAGAIEPVFLNAGSGTAEIEGKKYSYDTVIDGPGKFLVQIAIEDSLQQNNLVSELKKKVGAKRNWQFELLVWGDDLIPLVATKLRDLVTLITECKDTLKKFEKATESEGGWKADMKGLVAEGKKFLAKVESHELKAFFPATVNALEYTLRNVVNSAPYYLFENGKFVGAKDYHTDGKKVLTYRGEEFNWDNIKRYIEEAPSVGGREFCLWVIKDLRRTAGQMRSELSDAIKAHKAAPGVDPWAERLGKAGMADLSPLEAEIRGTRPAPKADDKK